MYNLNSKEIRIKRQTTPCYRFQNHTRSSHRRCSVKMVFLKNFANFTGKNLCRDLFLIKLQVWKLLLRTPFLKNTCERLLLSYEKLLWIPKTMVLLQPWNYIIVSCYNGTRPQTFLLKISKILWSYSGWQLPKLSQKTKIRSVLALKSLLLPQLMSFWYDFR